MRILGRGVLWHVLISGGVIFYRRWRMTRGKYEVIPQEKYIGNSAVQAAQTHTPGATRAYLSEVNPCRTAYLVSSAMLKRSSFFMML